MFDPDGTYRIELVDTSIAPCSVPDTYTRQRANDPELVDLRTVRYYSDSQTKELHSIQLEIWRYEGGPNLNVDDRG